MLDTFGKKKKNLVEIACFNFYSFTILLLVKKLLGHFNNLIFIISFFVAILVLCLSKSLSSRNIQKKDNIVTKEKLCI